MKFLLSLLFLTTFSIKSFSQEVKSPNEKIKIHDSTLTYAYVLVEGKLFSKKLKVNVDLGDTPEQKQARSIHKF